MNKVVFIRHGQTVFNAVKKFQGSSDIVLNEIGKLQASRVVLPYKNFDYGIHTGLSRSEETLQLILESNNISITTFKVDLFKERKYGIFEGKSHDYLKENNSVLYNLWKNNENTKIEGAETIEEVMSRMKNGLKQIYNCNKTNFIVVSHSGSMNALYKWLHNIPPNEPSGLKINNCNYYELDYQITGNTLNFEFKMRDYIKKGSIDMD